MTNNKKTIGNSNKPIDADLKFWGAATSRLVAPPTRLQEIRSNFWFTVGVIATAYLGWCIYDRFFGPLPTVVKSISIESANIPVNGKLVVSFNIVRNRTCQRNFVWIIADHTGHRERFSESPMDAIGKPGVDNFTQDFRVPADMQPGKARLRIIWSWSCPENLLEAVYPVPLVLDEINFNIVP